MKQLTGFALRAYTKNMGGRTMQETLRQSYRNPYSNLTQKDYGHECPQLPFMERHGKRAGAIVSIVSVIGVFSFMGFFLVKALP